MDIIKEWWSLIMAGVALTAWLLRLEGRAKLSEAEIARLWAVRKEDKDTTNALLAEIRSDIKALLRERG